MNKPAIQTFNLSKKFDNREAVHDLTIEVEQGEIIGFLGPNGAGKTTTIRMLTGIIAPTSGYAIVSGFKTGEDTDRIHEVTGLLTETPGFYNRLSALRNLEFFAGFYPAINGKVQVEKYLKIMGLWERRNDRVGSYSKGMKHRLAIARALLHEPKVIFLDEPTSGLDPEAASEVRNIIRELGKENHTIFLSTHNLTEAESLCQRIAIIQTHLIAIGTMEQLRQRFYRSEIAIELENIDDILIEKVRLLPYVQNVTRDTNRLLVELAEIERNKPELVKMLVNAGGRILSVTETRQTLEEVYLQLIHQEKEK